MKFIHEVQCQHYFINLLKALVFFSQTFFFTIIAWLLWSRVRPQQFSSHIWVWCFKQTCRKTLIPISGKSVDKDVILNVQMVFRQRQTCGGAVLSLIHICSAVLCTLLDTILCLWKLCCFSVTTDKGSLECHSEQFFFILADLCEKYCVLFCTSEHGRSFNVQWVKATIFFGFLAQRLMMMVWAQRGSHLSCFNKLLSPF